MDSTRGTPVDPVEDAVAVYDRTAAGYSTTWDGFSTREMDVVVGTAGINGSVLDAGCGPGRDLGAFERLGVEPTGVDLSTSMVAMCAANGHRASVADLRSLPFAAGAFDGVWASASLVHLDVDGAAAALAEMFRVARPGAALFASVKRCPTPCAFSGWEGSGEDARFFHYWTEVGFGDVVDAAGFTLRSIAAVADSHRANVTWVHVLATR